MGVQIPSGRPKKDTLRGVFFLSAKNPKGFEADRKENMPLWGIFREERLWRHSYAHDATSEAESLGLYKVLRAEVVIR